MKIATLTMLEGNFNYGAVLQTYALVKYISSLGHDCKTIRLSHYVDGVHNNRKLCIDGLTDRIKRKLPTLLSQHDLVNNICNIYGRLIGHYEYEDILKSQEADEERFRKFIKDYIPTTKLFTKEDIKETNSEFDVFVCGSDQIWKPECTNGSYFLDFCDENKLMIAYAPSISMYELTDDEKDYYKDKLKRYDYFRISSREIRGAQILSEIIGRDISTVVDPTLLIERKEWIALASSCERIIKEPYCFSYLLTPNLIATYKIDKYAKKNGLKFANISYGVENSYYSHIKPDYCMDNIGPIEFLNLLLNADYIFTDSYHGCIFAILFNRCFSVVRRNVKGKKREMFSRFDTLIEYAGIEKQIISIKNIGKAKEEVFDYYENLIDRIGFSKEYINEAINR